MATFTQHLRERGEAGLIALLAQRPDLAAPPPSSVRTLAARAANRASLDRALAAVDSQVLAVLEAVLALDPAAQSSGGPGVTVDRVAHAVDLDVTSVIGALRTAYALALVWTDDPLAAEAMAGTPVDHAHLSAVALHPTPGLADVLGPYPAGLGPTLAASLARRSNDAIARLRDELGLAAQEATPDEATALDRLTVHLADPTVVTALLETGPPGVRAVLDALAWGPPVGRSPAATAGSETPARTAVEWLLRHGLLAVGDPQHVVLPREVALVLRAGRTHARPPVAPAHDGTAVDPRTVDAESAQHAEEAVRLVREVLLRWGHEQPPVLRSGGLGSRELRRLATELEVSDESAALAVELAGAAGLVADDGGDPPAFAPTLDTDDWFRLPLPGRWHAVAEAWLSTERAAWLVGTRDDRGSLRAALDPESRRPWAPRLRTAVLTVLADAGTPSAPTALTSEQVHETLCWRTPRAAPPLPAVQAVLREATVLGLLGAGAISSAGRALVTGAADAAEVLASRLPVAVDEVLLQGDLTGIVPGRPSADLADLLEQAAEVESRGAGLTVRFTEASVRAALDAGRSAEDLLSALSRHARSGVPQPLEYLVLDAARRHGHVRVGMASSYLRADDPTLLAGLVEDKSLRALGLLRLAPTVIAAQATPAALLAALRGRGLAPVTEDGAGRLVLTEAAPRRVRGPRSRRTGPAPAGSAASAAAATLADQAQERRLRRVVKDLFGADRRELAILPGEPDQAVQDMVDPEGTPDPVLSLALLRQAAAEGREVWLELVGPEGITQRRRVRPLRVDAGRVRAIDAEREAELTVAVHRIANVTPV